MVTSVELTTSEMLWSANLCNITCGHNLSCNTMLQWCFLCYHLVNLDYIHKYMLTYLCHLSLSKYTSIDNLVLVVFLPDFILS